MDFGAIFAAVVSAIGMFYSMGKEEEAASLRRRMAAEYGDEILPELDRAVAQEAGASALGNAVEDPRGRLEQQDVADELASIYDTAGQTEADQAAYEVARRGVSQRAAQQAGDIAITAAQRGQTGSGLSSVLASQAGQDELEALAGLNAEVASSARQRALQALQARGGMANAMRGQDWNVMSEKANAMDVQNRFNASQRQSAEMYNVGIPQMNFNNRMGLIGARNAANEGVAQGAERSGQAGRQTAAGLANAGLSYGQAWDWGQEDKKHEADHDGGY